METEKKQNIYKIIMLVVLTIIITFLITSIVIYKYVQEENYNNYNYNYANLKTDEEGIGVILNNFKEIIDKYYLGEVNEATLLEGAIKGYVNGLNDPYTEYYTKEEMEKFKEETMGKFNGIGIYMASNRETNQIIIIQPIKDTPAYNAGLLPEDIILKVDDVSYTGEQLTEASSKIKGEPGTKVKLEILRGEEILSFEIERKEVKIYHIESKVLEGNIGYLEIVTFDEGCYEEFKQKYEELKAKNIKSLIIDLRNNGGGIVDEAVNIADMFTEKGKDLLVTVDKNGKEEIRKAKNDVTIDIPTVILVNQNTASASEILTGILKDYNKATAIGVKTYGKGVIQQLLTLNDGSGIKITTNEYYTPSRNKIEKEGIEPNITIELPEDITSILNIEEGKDTQLKKAIEVLKNR